MTWLNDVRTGLRAARRRRKAPPVPRHLAGNFTALAGAGEAAIVASLKRNYFPRRIWGEASMTGDRWLATPEGQNDLHDHLHRRLNVFRQQVVPWLDAAKRLKGADVLEIGCGTGASTVALAEQGARVVAVDIDVESVEVARDRCRAHGADAEFVIANATDAARGFEGRHFDFIIFFACLEHMTHAERMSAMRDTWNRLSGGDLWCMVETPNRLWYFDDHTSQLDFYQWLPDELAFDYSRLSPRHPFNASYRERSDAAMLSFLRHGRGLSYHELDLAMLPAEKLDVVSCLHLRLRKPGFLGWRELKRRRKLRSQYEALLARVKPNLHRGFFQPYLDLIIRKP